MLFEGLLERAGSSHEAQDGRAGNNVREAHKTNRFITDTARWWGVGQGWPRSCATEFTGLHIWPSPATAPDSGTASRHVTILYGWDQWGTVYMESLKASPHKLPITKGRITCKRKNLVGTTSTKKRWRVPPALAPREGSTRQMQCSCPNHAASRITGTPGTNPDRGGVCK